MRLGTRGSARALAPARAGAAALGGAERVPRPTAGARARARGDKERWVAEIDAALLRGDVDLAVHSAKDVPAELAPGIVIAAVPPRADPRDALCGAAALGDLPAGARVGTSSLRRAAQLRALREDLDVAEVRGNVDTRLGRLAAGDYDAIVLAMAGLERLGRAGAAGTTLDAMVPAAGQGALAVTVRESDARDVLQNILQRQCTLIPDHCFGNNVNRLGDVLQRRIDLDRADLLDRIVLCLSGNDDVRFSIGL